jgi:glycosyltransferase involved in cell wall biosynthesis
MDVSIVIRTKNEGEFIGETLNKVSEQEFSGKYEVVVVDSGSTDGTLDVIKKYDVRLIQIDQREFTYGHSLNIGANHSKGRFVVNLSAHALPVDEAWLTNLITGFEDHNVAGVYGRQLSNGHLNPFEALQNEVFFGEKSTVFDIRNKTVPEKAHFSNSNSAIRKDVWERFKFNELVPYAEDILWQTEVMRAEFSIVYAADAAVHHTHRLSLHNTYKSSRDCGYTLALMKEKRQSIPLIIFDVGIFLGLIPSAMFQNIRYMWRHNYLEYLPIAPFIVMCGWLGWLVGRIRYRLKK